MQKIIAVIDSSVYATSVCDHAAWLAKRINASVELVHVISRDIDPAHNQDLSGSIGLGARTALLEELSELDKQRATLAKSYGRALLSDAKTHLESAGVTTVTTRLRHDELSAAVGELESEADVVVIGKRGNSANFATLHIGPNLERVARTSEKPLFVASRAFKDIQRVLIAFDGGRSVARAIDMMTSTTAYQGLEIELLAVGLTPDAMKKRLSDAETRLRDACYTVTVKQVSGIAEEVIAKEVNEQQFDLLLMGAYGHSRIRNLLIGSTTTEMLRLCQIPVVLFR